MHGSLPTNQFRAEHHLTMDSSCQKCGEAHATLLHTLRDCNKNRRIWDLLGFYQHPNFESDDFSDWIYQFSNDARGTLFVLTCWIIWRARNAVVFTDREWEDWQILSNIHSLQDSILKAFGTMVCTKKDQEVIWTPPMENVIKINVDGSSFGNPGGSGFGVLLRNMNGDWIVGFSGFCGLSNNMNAGLLAIAQGLSIAWNAGHREVICETDSKIALIFITDGVSKFHPYAPLVDHIRNFSTFSWKLSFKHTFREGNVCADWLAKHGASSDQALHIWNSCPPQLSSVLLADAMGVPRIRA